MSEPPFLSINALEKRYGGFTALHPIDFDVVEGEFLTIVGPSGSGKTTLIKLLVGMEEPSQGTITLQGKRIDTLPANRRPTCMVFQSLALFPHRSVGQNIEFPLKIRGVEPAQRRQRAEELLNLFRLPLDYYDKAISACSGGEKQRIALARALAFDPDILFFDEPLSALDFRLRKTLEKELKALHTRTGKTFVYITHSLEEAMVMSDRIAILRAGRFEQIGTAAEIYSRPESRFVAEFMGDVNLFDIHESNAVLSVPGLETHCSLTAVSLNVAASAAGPAQTLMVRPEKLRFLQTDESADFVVTGAVQAEYMLGSRTQYEILSHSGKVIMMEEGNDAGVSLSRDDVRVGFDLAQCHLLNDPVSEAVV